MLNHMSNLDNFYLKNLMQMRRLSSDRAILIYAFADIVPDKKKNYEPPSPKVSEKDQKPM